MWDKYAKCPKCDKRYEMPFGSKFHIHLKVCSKCGTPKNEWSVATERWSSDSIWYIPSTWGSGHWDTLGD